MVLLLQEFPRGGDLIEPRIIAWCPGQNVFDQASVALGRWCDSRNRSPASLDDERFTGSLNRVEDLPLKEGYRLEQDYTRRLTRFQDSAEARLAYLEKRPPAWTWR